MDPAANRLRHVVVVATLIIGAFGAGVYFALGPAGGDSQANIPGLLWPNPPRVDTFALTNADGQPLDTAYLTGKWTLVFFGFTHCPDVCPTTLATLKSVRELLITADPFKSTLQVLFVSVDPERDNPAALKSYVSYFDPSFNAATGTEAELKAIARELGIIYAKIPTADPAVYNVDHTASVLLIGPAATLIGVFPPPHRADQIAQRVRQIAAFAATHS
ncbi:MAG: SCO family protein [Gammaproteobacteria bacterium]|nr:SCO family protein [Gammaproteobacteria bacterium]